MKKLMIATAALAACFAGFGDGIESANVVGYEQMGLTAGKQVMKGAMFYAPGGSTLSLQAVTPGEGVDPDGATKVWWWNKDTRTYSYAFWVLSCDEDGNYLNAAGEIVEDEADAAKVWGDEEMWIAIDKQFAPGEAFWVQPADGATAPDVTIAGEVLQPADNPQYVACNLTAGKQEQYTQPFPVGSFALNSLKMSEGVDPDGATKIWWWDMNTRTYTYAFWVLSCDEDGNYLDAAGQVVEDEADAAKVFGDEEMWVAIDKQFVAGEGFWVQPADGATNPQILFPNPFYKSAE